MNICEGVLQNEEKIMLALRGLYLERGYKSFRMSKFEEYDLYAGNKDFLVSDNVITFTDTDGKLMALKPDVTLSIIKNGTDEPERVQKVFYNENVYRVSKGTGSFKEIMQTGVECIGNVGTAEVCEVLTLAAESLRMISGGAVIALSDLSVLSEIVDSAELDAERQRALFAAVGEKNVSAIRAIAPDAVSEKLTALLGVSGMVCGVTDRLDALLSDVRAYGDFRKILCSLSETKPADVFCIDFSVTGDPNYYNGTIFKGFVPDVPEAVLSGGQYDRLMSRMGKSSRAVGFAVYTDAFDRLDLSDMSGERACDGFINVALPKGRLGEKIYRMFEAAGFECPAILEPNRKLIFENPERGVRYFWVKPSDVAIYVERGAADIGVAGKDITLEYEPDVYELLDLKKGACRMAVAGPRGYTDDPSKTLRVATKFSNIAKNYYRAKGRDIDIIHLTGSIEIAPILGLSDVIVDIVETGATLRENDLEVLETVVPISARLIANKAAFRFKGAQIEKIAGELARITEENDD